MIYTERLLETSMEEQQFNVGEFSDRFHWTTFLGLATSIVDVSVHTHQVNKL